MVKPPIHLATHCHRFLGKSNLGRISYLAEHLNYSVTERRSDQIQNSQVLLGFAIPLVEEALLRSQTEDDGAINRWLLATFS
jgi:hypothetical protein